MAPAPTSRISDEAVCGALELRGEWSKYGRTHAFKVGSGRHTVGTPSCIGIPSAPGNVPK
jgi:hypothetical protein